MHWRSSRKELARFFSASFDFDILAGSEALESYLAVINEAERERYRIFFAEMVKTDQIQPISFVCSVSGSPIAASLGLVFENELYMRNFSCSDHMRRDSSTYFALCLYMPIRFCIERELRYLSSGIGADDAKIRRGFCEVPQIVLAVERN